MNDRDIIAELRTAIQSRTVAHKAWIECRVHERDLKAAYLTAREVVKEIQSEIATGRSGLPIIDRVGTAPTNGIPPPLDRKSLAAGEKDEPEPFFPPPGATPARKRGRPKLERPDLRAKSLSDDPDYAPKALDYAPPGGGEFGEPIESLVIHWTRDSLMAAARATLGDGVDLCEALDLVVCSTCNALRKPAEQTCSRCGNQESRFFATELKRIDAKLKPKPAKPAKPKRLAKPKVAAPPTFAFVPRPAEGWSGRTLYQAKVTLFAPRPPKLADETWICTNCGAMRLVRDGRCPRCWHDKSHSTHSESQRLDDERERREAEEVMRRLPRKPRKEIPGVDEDRG